MWGCNEWNTKNLYVMSQQVHEFQDFRPLDICRTECTIDKMSGNGTHGPRLQEFLLWFHQCCVELRFPSTELYIDVASFNWQNIINNHNSRIQHNKTGKQQWNKATYKDFSSMSCMIRDILTGLYAQKNCQTCYRMCHHVAAQGYFMHDRTPAYFRVGIKKYPKALFLRMGFRRGGPFLTYAITRH